MKEGGNMIQKSGKYTALLVVVCTMWIQTYLTYKTSFDLKVENLLQEIILFINPLPFLLLIFGVALFFKTAKKRNRYYLIGSGILTFVLYGNVVFYRFYSDFITLPVLFQTSNFGDLGNSITTLISLKDIWYATGFLIIYITLKKIHSVKEFQLIKKEERRTYFIFSVAVLCFNLGLAEIERPQLLTRSFDREILVKSIGTFDYHLYDAFVQSKSHAQRVLADGSELTEVSNYVKSNQAEPNPSYFGLAKDRNVIIISLESMQNFVINNQVKGQTITPFLNELTKDPDTFYFDEFYHQTGLGKTSDAEFIVENSMYGTGRGAVFFTNAGNTFESMASRLNDTGYYTSVMHANNKSFWNRDLMYESLHIKKFFDVASYNVTEKNSANWGLKDIPFMEQSVKLMEDLPQPFYTRMLTLSNHFPFTSDEEDQYIKPYDSGDETVDRYFQTARYTDEAVKVLFQRLKQSGLYDNSIIVMYGDHYGISDNHNKAMARYLGKDAITPYDAAKLQRVPFFIHIPGSNKGKVMHEVAGELDIRPTILHLLGLNTTQDVQFGQDLLSKEHQNFTVFRDGRFVTDRVVYAAETFYDAQTGKPIQNTQPYEKYIKQANRKLEVSDQVINGDLLRFYDKQTGQITE